LPNSPPLETELKLAVSPAGERRLAKHAAFQPPRASEPTSEHIVTTYFDTPRHDLARRGLSLRVRRAGKERIQAVKADGDGGAAMARGEWEWPVAQETPDLGLVAGTPVAEALASEIDRSLEPVVVTDIVRTKRIVEWDGAVIEAALDAGSIEAGDSSEPIHELELELRKGAPGALFRLALALHAATPLSVEVESKAARGYRLKDGSPPQAEKPKPSILDPKVRATDGLNHVIAGALGHLLLNRAAALAGDREGIHQVRVAIRRVRSALMLFEPRLEPHALSLFQDELKRLGRAIGEARDWDVFCADILPAAFDGTENTQLGELIRDAAEARRHEADAACTREIRSPSFTALILGLAAWTEAGREQRTLLGDRRLDRRLSRIAPALVDRLSSKVQKRGRALGPGASPETLHPLRKSAKKLRYAVEFLASLYPKKDAKRFVKRLKALQKSLGVINDGATAIRLAEELARGGRLELGVPIGALAASRKNASAQAMRKLDKQWAAFERQGGFWR
jgi:inorganic triphosphatase YgiF